MKHLRWPQLFGLLLLAAVVAGAAAAPAAAAAPGAAGADDPAAAAVAYLQARGSAVAAADPAAVLAPWLAPGSRLAAVECAVARGAALRAARLGHLVDGVDTQVTVTHTAVQPGGDDATVTASVVTTLDWHARSGDGSVEAAGLDHTVSLRLTDGAWRVVADVYSDVQTPAYLESAGLPARAVRAATARLERASPSVTPRLGSRAAAAAPPVSRYIEIIYYDRDAARAYADKYALSYNPTYVRFTGADCANFASQCGLAGGMPMAVGGADSGWWYSKKGTSSPGDDAYSLSWINVGRQMSFWNTRRTDWVPSISDVARGDFVYYDWSGDGVWDHVAVFAGTNSAGQKVVDAHTTDHYRVYWKLGWSSTRYKFAHTDPTWLIN
jgi:cell wall-associated NlpC family hydrolase